MQHRLRRLQYRRGVRLPGRRIRTAAKGKEEACTLILLRFYPDASTVAENNTGDCRQTNAGALKLGCLMQALERHEKFFGSLHIEARSVVSHAKDSFIRDSLQNKTDSGIRLFGCELPGVAQQVFQGNLDKTFVAVCSQPVGDFDDDLACGISHAEVRNDGRGHLREIDLFRAKLDAVDSGKIQKVV